MTSRLSYLTPSKAALQAETESRESHPWAVQIARERFCKGLDQVFDGVFVESRFRKFVRKADPIYVTLLQGMGDENAARMLVGNWMIAHTLATQARFWMEDVVVDILFRRSSLSPELRPEIYDLRMLADGWFATGRSLWDVGENWREEVHGRGAWRPAIQEGALEEIERIVGEEERRFETFSPDERRWRPDLAAISEEVDRETLNRVARSLRGSARPISVRCNLLFLEPETSADETAIWAIRYINPTTFGQLANVKGERVNLLRLRAYLAQEKPLRAPSKSRVLIADLLPRTTREESSGLVTSHFSPYTRWRSEDLWEFLGVPFAAVTAGIRDAGTEMRSRLVERLRSVSDRENPAS